MYWQKEMISTYVLVLSTLLKERSKIDTVFIFLSVDAKFAYFSEYISVCKSAL
jgi:hypothetical protein